MKKILILLILLPLFLTGCACCGVYNISNFVIPDDIEFINDIQELNTPCKICQYMADNITYEAHLYAVDPYTFWQTKKGDCNDTAIFAVFVATYHGYSAWKAVIYFPEGKHAIAIFKEPEGYSFSDNIWYNPINTITSNCFKNFRECVEFDFLWKGDWFFYKIYDYNNNLIEKVQR